LPDLLLSRETTSISEKGCAALTGTGTGASFSPIRSLARWGAARCPQGRTARRASRPMGGPELAADAMVQA
jgi:hypothetical protein